MDVKEFFEKYDEMCFRFAIAHLFDKGMSFFKKANLDELTSEIEKSVTENSIISNEMQVQINHCAYELAKFDVWDILKFVKTKLDMSGVTVHEGKIVSFRENCTGDEKAWYMVSSDTDTERIGKAEKLLEEKVSQHEEENGIFSEFEYESEIYDCLKSAGVKFENAEPDIIVYI